MFPKSKYNTDISRNAQYLALFRSPSDRNKSELLQTAVGMWVRMGSEVISIQNGGGMLTSSIRRAHGVRTKVRRLRKHSVLKWSRDHVLESDWLVLILYL